jgi:hypothetical protein
MARLVSAVECDSAANRARADERQAGRLPRMGGDPIPEPDATSGTAGRHALGDDLLGRLGGGTTPFAGSSSCVGAGSTRSAGLSAPE